MSRRVTGEGSIYRRKDGRYEVAIYSPTTSGKRKRIREYATSRAEADEKLTALKSRIQHGIPAPDKNWRLGEYLDYWLEEVVRSNRRPATYAQCEMITRLYLKPHLGKLLLRELSASMVQRFMNQLLANGVSVPTAHIVRKVLSSALTCALREEQVTRNVARLVILPAQRPLEVRPWSIDEARKFLYAARGHTWELAFMLLLLYGLRRGEVLGLRWGDVDFGHEQLRIRQQIHRSGDHLQAGPLKTHAAKRDLPMLNVVRCLLRDAAMRRPGAVSEDALVFSSEAGSPLEASVLVRSFQRLCERQSLRKIRIHDLRHTTATLLKALQVPVRDAQLILGHARISTTQELYQHDSAEERRASLELVETALLGEDKSLPRVHEEGFEEHGGGGRSRQVSRQTAVSAVNTTTSVSGAGNGTLTHGLILGKSIGAPLADRLASVNRYMHVRLSAWNVGVVAVNVAVKPSELPTLATVRRSAPVSAAQLHVARA